MEYEDRFFHYENVKFTESLYDRVGQGSRFVGDH